MTAPTQVSVPSRPPASAEQGIPEVQRVLEVDDPVLRNGLITQAYHELGLRLRTTLRREDANWAIFATWTSRASGKLLRGERVPALVHTILESAMRGVGVRHALPVLPKRKAGLLSSRVLESVHEPIARGNLEIFLEFAPLFNLFTQRLGAATRPDDPALARFLGRLDAAPSLDGGQELLVHGFRAYIAARFERDDKRAVEQILHANILLAWHEQLRLRPRISDMLETPVAELLRVTELHGARRLGESWRYVVTHAMLTSCVPEARRLPTGPRARRCFADCALPVQALEYEFRPLGDPATTRETPRKLDEVTSSLRIRMQHTARWYWENQRNEALARPPFTGKRQASLSAFSQAPEGALPGTARSTPTPANDGTRRGPGDRWHAHEHHHRVLQAALAISAPRRDSEPPENRRTG